MRRAISPILGAVVLAIIGVLAGLLAWAVDQGSLERANRLHRGEAFEEAARIYADHLAHRAEPGVADRIRYNLGTALLGLGDAGARDALAGVGRGAGVDVHVRALNNLGLWRIIEAAKTLGQNAARAHAVAAIAAYKSALRLQPGHQDASWNLAIALRMLASIDAGDYVDAGQASEGDAEREGDAPPADDPADANEDDAPVSGPKVGEGEAAAQAVEDRLLAPDAAAAILGTAHRDPTKMVSKLVALGGRTLRQRASGRDAVNSQK